MQIRTRPLEPGEINHELIWLAVSVTSIGLAAIWLGIGLPWPRCAFHDLTGHPCLTCGMTRSAIRFFHGDFIGALRWNPLIFLGLCAVTIFDVYAIAVLTRLTPRLRLLPFRSGEKKFFRILVIVLLMANWIYLLSRPPGFF
ncbi:MAG TPA: DUF2752 domain-containing protein [Chthoniobacterales bacterium]|nr:DUF2752 domain-containing protein [Chthoniobacterales bacterium]